MNAPPLSQSPRRIGKAAGIRSTRQFPWTKEEDALLGKFTDREVAEKLNRTLYSVRDRRKFLGRTAVGHPPQPARMKREPRDGYARLFSAKSNRDLRAMLGWSYKRIRTRRRQLAGGKVRKMQPEWTLEEDRLLGTKPDRVLARKFGRSVGAVRHRRQKKRISLMKKWRPEDEKILGTRTDRQVALLLGRSITNISWRRARLGIPPKAKPRPWTDAEEALLGKKPDAELARLFGRTEMAVEGRRIQLGRLKPDPIVCKVIKRGAQRSEGERTITFNAKPRARYCTWSPAEDALIGTMPDAELAARLGVSVERVRRRRHKLAVRNANPARRSWTDAEIALLGTAPDREVGKLMNRSLANVRFKRLELGIPFRNPHYEVWKPDELVLLGTLPDKEVARRTGHALTSVRHARSKREILSVRRAAPEWRPEEESLLGTAPDQEIAARLNRTLGAVRLRRVNKGIPTWRAPIV